MGQVANLPVQPITGIQRRVGNLPHGTCYFANPQMTPLVYNADDETATEALGAALAEVLPEGTTVALCGTLGAGKTRLVQAIAAAWASIAATC